VSAGDRERNSLTERSECVSLPKMWLVLMRGAEPSVETVVE
jgi:hypothetical protein